MGIILEKNKKELVRLNTLSLEKDDHKKPLSEFYKKTGKRLWCIIPSPYEVFLKVTTVDLYDTVSGRTYHRFPTSNPIVFLSSEQSTQLVSFGSCDLHEISDLFEINKDFSISKITVEDIDRLVNSFHRIVEQSQTYESHYANPFVRHHRKVLKFVCGFSKKIEVDNFGEKDFQSHGALVTLEHVLIKSDDFDTYLNEYIKIFPEAKSSVGDEWIPFGITLVNRINDRFREDLINDIKRSKGSKKKEIEKYVLEYSGKKFSDQKLGDILRIVEDKVIVYSESFYRIYKETPLKLLDVVNVLSRFDKEARLVVEKELQNDKSSSLSSISTGENSDQIFFEDPKKDISENVDLIRAVYDRMGSALFRKRSKNGDYHRRWIEEELHILGYENVRRLSQTVSELIRMRELK